MTQDTGIMTTKNGWNTTMTKKKLIALADCIKEANQIAKERYNETLYFNNYQQVHLANWCKTQNPKFLRGQWLGYINDECGPNGGKKTK
jgi:hypothetical protein